MGMVDQLTEQAWRMQTLSICDCTLKLVGLRSKNTAHYMIIPSGSTGIYLYRQTPEQDAFLPGENRWLFRVEAATTKQ